MKSMNLQKALFLLFALFLILLAIGKSFSQVMNPGPAGRLVDGSGSPPYLEAAYDVMVQGQYAYVTSPITHALEIIDISLPGAPQHKGSITGENDPYLGEPRGLFVAGNYAYITAGVTDVLDIIDISNPSRPAHVGACALNNGLFTSGGKVAVQGDYAYVTSTGSPASGVMIIDIKNPAAPSLSSVISGIYKNVTVSGNYAYAISGSNLSVINLSTLVVKNRSISSGLSDIKVSGNYAYALNGSSLSIIDVPNLSNAPISVAVGTNNLSVSISNGYAYVVGSSGTLEIVNISNPQSPTPVGTLTDGAGGAILTGANSVFTVNNDAYVASALGYALEIVDVSVPSAPIHKSSLSAGVGGAILQGARSIAFSGNYAFITSFSGNGLEVVDITDPGNPSHKTKLLDGQMGASVVNPVGVAISGNYAYVVNENGAATVTNPGTVLQVIDISSPENPTPVGKLSSANPASAIFILGSYAYMATASGSSLVLQMIDIKTSPTTPTVVASITEPVSFSKVSASFGKYNSIFVRTVPGTTTIVAYVTASPSLDMVYVTTSPAPALTHAGTISNLTGASSVAVSGNYAYVACYPPFASAGGTLQTVNVLDPTKPSSVASYSNGIGFDPMNVTISGNYALVTTYFGKSLVVFNLASPVNPPNPSPANPPSLYTQLLSGSYTDLSFSNKISINGDFAYVLNNSNSMQIVNLYSPSLQNFTPATGNVNDTITLSGQNLDSFLSASFGGLNSQVLTSSATAATVKVPTGAKIGSISIIDHSKPIFSTANFLVIPVLSQATNIQQDGFISSWSDVGAARYFIDVSTDNFATFVNSYQNDSVGNVISYAVTGLQSGVNYQYRVRAFDGTTSSGASNVVSALTIPATPTPSAAFLINQNSFSVSWDNITGATGYNLDVATDSGFSSILGSYNNLPVSGNSHSISGLTPGVNYYWRVRSSNASGASPNSSIISLPTIPANPVTQSVTNALTNGFTINWISVPGATGYSVDLSADNFVTVASGYSNLSVGNVSSYAISGLLPSTTYQYRIRASNTSGNSGNSNITAALTLTPIPTAQPTTLTFSNASASSVNVSYSLASDRPSGYLVLRSANAQPSTAPASGTTYIIGASVGNSIVAFSGPSLSFFDGGLPTGVTYYYAVYSFNGSGASILYLTTNPLLGNVTLDVQPPKILQAATPIPSTITGGNAPFFNTMITDNVGVSKAQIFYRGISKSPFNSASLTPSGAADNYAIQIQTDWYDSLGLEYYFYASDGSGNEAVTEHRYVPLITPSISLPALPSGTSQKDFRIIAFPYELATDNKVTTVYSGVPWNDNTKAAMWQWKPSAQNGQGAYDQYGTPNTFLTVEPGHGYWAITKTSVTPQLANVPAPKYNRSNLYTMTLQPNWNEVGNPYPVPISWDEVIAFNQKNNVTSFGPLSIYDSIGQNSAGYKTATGSALLRPFEGGFVQNLSSSPIMIQIPFPGQTSIGGRMESIGSDISQEAWNVFLHVSQEDFTNQLGGFGMHPLAKPGPDRYDNFNPPQFMESPEVNFKNIDYPNTLFSKDMVPSQENYHWRFTPNGKSDVLTQLKWTEDLKNISSNPLFLLNEQTLEIIDMMQVSSYQFSLKKGSRFSIFYGLDISKIALPEVAASAPYPNPLTSEAAINLNLPDSGNTYEVALQVFNNKGELLGSTERILPSGIQPLKFGLADQVPSGMYLYKLNVRAENTAVSFTGKIIKL